MIFPNYEIDETEIIRLATSFKIKELYVFGSILTDKFNENSDIDILVSFKESSRYSYFELEELKERFTEILNRPVDLIEKEGLLNPFRKEEILNTARKVYECN